MLEACADEGVAVVPFGGGTSVVGGVEPLRDGLDAVISLDLGAHRATSARVDKRSLTAVLGAGLRGPAVEAGARRPRAHARPLPAVVRVRDRRRLGRDALGGPGLDRLRRDRQARLGPALRRAGGRDRPARRCRRPRPAPALRQLLVGSEGLLGVITEATLKVRPQPAGAALRGLDVPRLRGGRRGVPGARAAPRDPRRRAPVRPARDAPVADALRRRLAAAPRSGGATSARAATTAAASRSSGWEGERRDVDARRALRAAHPAAAPAACRWAPGPGAPGSAGASTGPTCATRCSTAA